MTLKVRKITIFISLAIIFSFAFFLYEVYNFWRTSVYFQEKSSILRTLKERQENLQNNIEYLKQELLNKKKRISFLRKKLETNYSYLSNLLKVQQVLTNQIVDYKILIIESSLKEYDNLFLLYLKAKGKEENVLSFCEKILEIYPSYLQDFQLKETEGFLTLSLFIKIPKLRLRDERI